MKNQVLILLIAIGMLGCVSPVNVRPVDPSVKLSHVCIQENQKVRVSDFLQVLRDGFDRHGITTEVFSGNTPSNCEFILTYTALQSWDFAMYLSHAELRIEKDGKQIAYAGYHLKGGLSSKKWQDTKTKMDPVIDELLKSK